MWLYSIAALVCQQNEEDIGFIFIKSSTGPESLLYTTITVDYSQWTINPLFDDYASFDVYIMDADHALDTSFLKTSYFPVASPFRMHRNVHLRGIANVVIRRVLNPSWRDFFGFQPVSTNS